MRDPGLRQPSRGRGPGAYLRGAQFWSSVMGAVIVSSAVTVIRKRLSAETVY